MKTGKYFVGQVELRGTVFTCPGETQAEANARAFAAALEHGRKKGWANTLGEIKSYPPKADKCE